MTPDPLHALVIGAGASGCAAALLLAHAGIATTLVERRGRVGGSSAGRERDGFRIDTGALAFCRGAAGPLGDVLRRVGRADAVAFAEARDLAELRWKAAPAPSPSRAGGVVRVAAPAELRGIPRFLLAVARRFGAPPRAIARGLESVAQAISMREADLAAWDDRPLAAFLSRFVEHPRLAQALGALMGFAIEPPYPDASAGEALAAFRRRTGDGAVRYPIGGASAVPAAYCRLARAHGAVVRTGVAVRRVVVREGRARGVELDDGSVIAAQIVVSTAGLRTTVSRLVGDDHFAAGYLSRVRSLRASRPAVALAIGLSRPLVAAGALLFSASPRDASGEPLICCAVPTRFDPSLSPPGRQLLIARGIEPAGGAPDRGDAMLSALRDVVPGLLENAIFVERASAAEARWPEDDAEPSVAMLPGQVGRDRPAVHTPICGLYLAGGAAGGRGAGLDLAASSALECVDRVLVDLGRDAGAPPPLGFGDAATAVAERAVRAWIARATRRQG